MSTRPTLSVIMPSYNQGCYIRQAIDSVLLQDYRPVQLLVMDGGSTDDTLSILRSYGDRLTFVSQKDDGQSDALNKGFTRARGDILCWLNSDDVFMPGALSTVVGAFRKQPDAAFVYGKGWNIDGQGRILGDSGVQPLNLWKLIHQRNYIHQPSCFFRRSLLEEVGVIRTGLHYVMDWELWIRFATHKGVFVEQFLSCNRAYAQNKTQSGALRRWREICAMVRSYTDRRYPPVVWIYLAEALTQLLRGRRGCGRTTALLTRLFYRGMSWELSGCYADGGIAPAFSFSAPNTTGHSSTRVVLTPLSCYDPARLGAPPLEIHWQSSAGQKGIFLLAENGRRQELCLPLAPHTAGMFTHFTCRTRERGIALPASPTAPARRIIGFLDMLERAAQVAALAA